MVWSVPAWRLFLFGSLPFARRSMVPFFGFSDGVPTVDGVELPPGFSPPLRGGRASGLCYKTEDFARIEAAQAFIRTQFDARPMNVKWDTAFAHTVETWNESMVTAEYVHWLLAVHWIQWEGPTKSAGVAALMQYQAPPLPISCIQHLENQWEAMSATEKQELTDAEPEDFSSLIPVIAPNTQTSTSWRSRCQMSWG